MLEEAVGQHHVERTVAVDGHGKRITTIGRTMGAGLAGGRLFRRKAGAERKPPPMPLATAMSGVMPAHSWAKSLPVRPTPHWTSVQHEQQSVFIANRPQGAQKFVGRGAQARPRPEPAR